MELAYLLDSGVSQIQVIKDKIQLLCQREGIPEFQDNNVASSIERVAVAINSLLITGKDLDRVICLICGYAPKMVLSDGNSKDTISVTPNMIYTFEETGEAVPDLEVFKTRLAAQMMRSAFFQNEKKENFDMTMLPNIIAPSLLKQQVNSDRDKETLFNKTVTYGAKSMTGLTNLISQKKINILDLDSLTSAEIKQFSKTLDIKQISDKSNVRLLEEIKFISKMFAAGQGMYLTII